MILQSLNDLYDRLKDDSRYQVPPAGFSVQKISFRVVLRPDGGLVRIEDVLDRTGKTPRPRRMIVPGKGKPPGTAINPGFLWDNSGYMLGFKAGDPTPERTLESFQVFRDRHLALEAAIDSAPFRAVCRFLRSWDPSTAADHPVLADGTTAFGVFQIVAEAAYVHEHPEVLRWWRDQSHDHPDADYAQCLITGESSPIEPTHPKVKGVRGAQSSGALLVSFNAPAYDSYGQTQSHNAPVSIEAARRYTAALNEMTEGPGSDRHRISLGDATIVFWTDRPTPTEDIFAQFAVYGSSLIEREETQDEGARERLELFLRALRKGGEAYSEFEDDPDGTEFFILGLAPNASRISVRFFHRSTLSTLLDNLRRHHRDIGITPEPARGKRPADPEFIPMWMLLRQTARDSKEIPPILEGPLLRSIVTGSLYPGGLYAAVLRRIHADRNVNYARVSAIKGYLTRNLGMEISMSLDTMNPSPACRLGRLFAAMEKTQGDALGTLNASIRDRFYSSASATPGTVIPRLLRTYQHHLAKLPGGRKVNREKLVQEILDPLDGFPTHLDLAGQGLFALGYYHQTRDFYTKKDPQDESEEQ